MSTYLITGGAGFIGSHITKKLLTAGHKLVVIDNLRTGLEENIPDGAEFLKVDIRSYKEIENLKNHHFDAILHLAAQSSGEISHDDPDYDLDTNARGTLNLLNFAYKHKIGRFLNASSMGVYGDKKKDHGPVLETDDLNPLSFYGVSKLSAEKYTNYFIQKGMNITSFRMFNVYGPGQNLENMKQGMVSIYMKFILDGLPVLVKGNKDRFRDLIFIEDVANAWVQSIDNENTFNKSYNLGTGKKTYVYEIVDNLLKAFGKDDNYPVEYTGGTPADQFGIYADINCLKKDLGWEPQYDIAKGLKVLADYYA